MAADAPPRFNSRAGVGPIIGLLRCDLSTHRSTEHSEVFVHGGLIEQRSSPSNFESGVCLSRSRERGAALACLSERCHLSSQTCGAKPGEFSRSPWSDIFRGVGLNSQS